MVEVLIPWAGGCPHREAALSWVRGRYPWPVTLAPAPPGPWCKARAVMPAAASSTADVVLVADADVWTDGIHQAVAEVQAGAPWAIPHRGVHRLSEASTRRVLAGADPEGLELSERAYRGIEGGGIVVIRRDLLMKVPMDTRFVGWGQEDQSWAAALQTLLGEPWRGRAPLWHLWHPPQPRTSRRRGNDAGWRLWRRYAAAHGDPAAMRLLLNEATDALHAPEPPRHDPAPLRHGDDRRVRQRDAHAGRDPDSRRAAAAPTQ